MAGPIDARLLRRGRATRNFLVALAGVGVAASALIIVQARLISDSVSAVFATHRLDGVGRWAGLLLLVFIARALLAWLNTILAHHAAASVKSRLRHDLVAARLARPLSTTTPTATLVRLATTGLDDLDGYYSKYLPQLILASIVPLLVSATIAWADLTSAIIVAITIPLIPIFMALIGWTTQAQVNRRLSVATRLANHFADLVTGLSTLQVFGRARGQITGLEKTEESHRRETMKTLRITFMSSLALETLATISVALVAVSVGFRVVFDQMDLRTALFVLVLAPEAFLPLRQVGVHYHDAADGMAAANAALEIIEQSEGPATDARTSAPLPWTQDAFTQGAFTLQFDQVGYRYDGVATDALAPVSFSVQPGEIVALAGPSGGGKSTALAIAAGFLHPTTGRVLVNDLNLADIDPASWHAHIAWVGQTPGMLRTSIAENVALGSPTASREQILAALRDAGADSLEPDRVLGDDAEGLSAGERRRVGVARALLRLRTGSARLLLLDEPTAGLDADTEATVLAAVRDAGVAALVVSHRAAVLDMVDRIVTIDRSQTVTDSAAAEVQR